MADEHIFIAHRCGYAVHFGKQLANDWRFCCEALNRLNEWLHEENPEGFWAYYGSDKGPEDPWVLLHEGMGNNRGFGITWTTPSGFMFSDKDYVVGKGLHDGDGYGIFRVIFIDSSTVRSGGRDDF